MQVKSINNVQALIDKRANSHGEQVFLLCPESGHKLSYFALQQDVRRVAQNLMRLGLQPGAKVGFMLHNGYAAVVTLLSTMYGGFVSVPLNLVAGQVQCSHVLQHSDIEVVVVAMDLQQQLQRALDTIEPNHCPIQIIDADLDTGLIWPAELEPGIDSELKSDPCQLTTPLPKDNALLMYTSGTTGQPKGAVLSHGNVIAGGRNTVQAHALTDNDRGLCVLPLYHINAQMVSVMATLISGGSLVMPHRFSVRQFWQLISDYECTWFSAVPTIITYLIEQDNQTADSFAYNIRLRFGRSASAPLPPSLHQAFEQRFSIPLIETMGLTETAAQILANPLPPKQRKHGSPGIPYGNQAKVVNRKNKELPPGKIGELLIRGPNIMQHYYKDTAATAQALDTDGWFHTGDIGYFDQDGFFYVAGRYKELIIKGGENISPREIDDVLYQHPAVLEAAAVAIPDPHFGQEIMAGIVVRPGNILSENDLRDFCTKQLGAFKTPKIIKFLDALPKGPSGKIQRLRLLELVD